MEYIILLKFVLILILVDNISGSEINVTQYEGVSQEILNSLPELPCKQVEVISNRVIESCIFDNYPRQIFMAGYNETSCFLCFINTLDDESTAKMLPSNMTGLNWFARQGPGDDAYKTPYGTYVNHKKYPDLIYPQAEALCRVSGAQISAFETKAEFQALASYLSGTEYWLNANDRRQDGHYVWETNLQPVTDIIAFDVGRTALGAGEQVILLGGGSTLHDVNKDFVSSLAKGVLCEF